MVDDGFIYLRIVRQFRAGNGPVFNAGQRVEAFTSPLWFAVLALADFATPLRLEWIAVLLGIGSTLAGFGFAMFGAAALWSSTAPDHLPVPFGALPLVALFPMWCFASGGLETGLAFGWLGGCCWILGRWASDPTRSMCVPAAVVLGLGWLVRPEFVLFSAAFLAVVLVGDRSAPHARRWRVVAAAIGLPVVFRMGYYGSLVANTAIAKEGFSLHWERGWRYLSDFGHAYGLWFPVLVVVAGGYLPLCLVARRVRNSRPLMVAGAFVGVSVLLAVWVVAVGGDYIHARLFLPPLFGLCAPVMAVPATRRLVGVMLLVPYAFFATVYLRPKELSGRVHNLVLGGEPFGRITTNDLGYGPGGPLRRWYSGPGYYVEDHPVTETFIRRRLVLDRRVHVPIGTALSIGLNSYAMGTDFEVVDMLGLADPIAAHLQPVPSLISRPPGHEKRMPNAWIAARLAAPGTNPAYADFPADFFFSVSPSPTQFQTQIAWARAASRCPAVKRLVASAEAPMSIGRFFDNLWESVPNTTVRIPSDPRTAYRQLCGSGVPTEVRSLRP